MDFDKIRRWIKEEAPNVYAANSPRTIMLDSETYQKWRESGLIREDGSIAIPLEDPADHDPQEEADDGE